MGTKQEPTDEALRGRRYIAYARCATAEGAEQRFREQIRLIHQFADGLNMHCAGEVRIANVNGWRPVMRPDLHELLARKRYRRDFEVLIMESYSRLSRAEPENAAMIEMAFAARGVTLVYLDQMAARP